jgi:hypothetical protein
MSKIIISVSLIGSNAVHGREAGTDPHATLCRPAGGSRPYLSVDGAITCKSCAKIIREMGESAPTVAPEPVQPEPDGNDTLRLIHSSGRHFHVDNSGNVYGTQADVMRERIRELISAGMLRVNGASRAMLDNGRTGRRIVLTIAGRNALGA